MGTNKMDIQRLKDKYLKRSHRCLNCGSEDIEGGSVTINAGGATQDIRCNKCESSWTDLYVLDDVVNIWLINGGDKSG
jgi:transcription elongation factor Elf1